MEQPDGDNQNAQQQQQQQYGAMLAQMQQLQQQNQQLQHLLLHHQQPQPHKVKLTPLWTAEVRAWFRLAEAAFYQYAVTEPRMKFHLAAQALPAEVLLHVKAVIEQPENFLDPYAALRSRLLEVYEKSQWQKAAELLRAGELGDRKPSTLMDELLTLVPGDLNILVKAAFLGRLPVSMRDHVQQGAEDLSFQELAAKADAIWHSRSASGTAPAVLAAVAVPEEEHKQVVDPEELEQVLAAVRFVKKQPGGHKTASGKASWCWRHRKFGKEAFECANPKTCKFSKN